MPYVVTIKHDGISGKEPWTFRERVVSRVAVATLLDAKCAAFIVVENHSGVGFTHEVNDLPESGGTVGPLPDGTMIHVESIGIGQLAALALCANDLHFGEMTEAEVITAFNAKQAGP